MAFRWGFRVATGASVGLGHAARCLALAEAMADAPVFFVDPGPGAADFLRARGWTCIAEADAAALGSLHEAARDGRIDGALYDGYAFAGAPRPPSRPRMPLVRFDDFGAAADADLVVEAGLAADAPPAGGPPALRGPAYAPLAAGYAEAHRRAASRLAADAAPRRVLVAFGARDSADLSGLALDALAAAGFDGDIVVAIGECAKHRETLAARIAGLPNARAEIGATDMIPLYESCDLAIGAGGVSLLERACCGLPQIVVAAAANQDRNARAAARLGVAEIVEAKADRLADAVDALRRDPMRRRRLARAGHDRVDGRGAARVAAALRALEVAT